MQVQSVAAFPDLDRLPVFDARSYGVRADGSTNDTAAFQRALDACGAGGGGTVALPAGTLKIATSVSLASSAPLVLAGQPGTILDGRLSTDAYLVTLGGSRGASAALGADVARGGRVLNSTLSASVTAGDLLLVTSTDLWSAETSLPKGEMVEVEAVSGSDITLKSPLADSYTAATTTLFLLSMPRVQVRDLRVLRNSNHAGIRLQYAREFRCERLAFEGCRERSLYLLYGHIGTVQACTATDDWYSGTATSYGLAVVSCQHLACLGNHWFGGRHGITHGSLDAVTRWVSHLGGTCDNDHSGTAIYAYDVHAGCEEVNVAQMKIPNGVGVLGRNCAVESCTIECDSFEAGIRYYANVDSDYFIARGNRIRVGNVAGYGIGVTPRWAGVTVGRVDLSDNIISELSGLASGARFGILLTPNDSTINGVTLARVLLRDNDVTVGGTSQALRLTSNGAQKLAIDRMTVRGGRYRSQAANAAMFTPTLAGELHLQEVEFESGGASATGITVSGFADVFQRGVRNRATGSTPVGNTFLNSGKLWLDGCRYENWATRGLLLTGGSQQPTEVLLHNSQFPGCGANVLGTARVFSEIGNSGNVVADGTAAPTTNTWLAGDVVRNTGASPGQPLGWQCVVAGTPGYWAPLASLASILDQQRVLLWDVGSFDGTEPLEDGSGNGNDGRFGSTTGADAGDPTFSTDHLTFTADDYLEAADAASLNFGAADSFTLVKRFSYPSLPIATSVVAAKKLTTLSADAGWALWLNTSGQILGSIADGTTRISINGPTLTAGQVYTVALVRDADRRKLYLVVDEVRTAESSDTTTGSLTNALAFRVGQLSGAGGAFADFDLYGLSLHRRVLTDAETVEQGVGFV